MGHSTQHQAKQKSKTFRRPAMMLLGFAGLGFMAYRGTKKSAAV
jgi:hypothetical protein